MTSGVYITKLAAVFLSILGFALTLPPASGAESSEKYSPSDSQNLEARYAAMLHRLRADIAGELPKIDSQQEAAFRKMNTAELAAQQALDKARNVAQRTDAKKDAAQAKVVAENPATLRWRIERRPAGR